MNDLLERIKTDRDHLRAFRGYLDQDHWLYWPVARLKRIAIVVVNCRACGASIDGECDAIDEIDREIRIEGDLLDRYVANACKLAICRS